MKIIKSNYWQTSRRSFDLSEKTLVMAILNITPDSFSDGGKFYSLENAVCQAEKFIENGADILDIGGESTRPNSQKISVNEETNRVVPVIKEIKKRFEIPISIDTSKASVAENAVTAGAEIINDISGLLFDEKIAEVASKYKTGLILMHSLGEFETMHKQKPVENILREVADDLHQSIEKAKEFGVADEKIALDVGIGFSKTFGQNLELIAKLDKLCEEFADFPFLIGTSRKSFIGKILNDQPPNERLYGTLATNIISVWNGAKIVRVHDVRETVEALKVVDAVKGNL